MNNCGVRLAAEANLSAWATSCPSYEGWIPAFAGMTEENENDNVKIEIASLRSQ
jgi:hypothetical protein